jgi:acetylornithine/succinyldiaminopimelate/putrescine aminotransferase
MVMVGNIHKVLQLKCKLMADLLPEPLKNLFGQSGTEAIEGASKTSSSMQVVINSCHNATMETIGSVLWGLKRKQILDL